MLVDEFCEEQQSRVGIIESDWPGGVSSTANRVVREGLSIKDLKEVKGQSMLTFGGQE